MQDQFFWGLLLRNQLETMPQVLTILCRPMVMPECTLAFLLDTFLKKITFQEITREGLDSIGDTVEIMAEAEGLEAHKRAVSIRRKTSRTET